MLSTYLDYQDWLVNQMESLHASSPQLNEESLCEAIYEIGNRLMNGRYDWDDPKYHLSESWSNSSSEEGRYIVGFYNDHTGIELCLPGIYHTLKDFGPTNYKQIEMFITFTLAHERSHRSHGDICKYHTNEEHDNHPNEIRAQRAGYEAVLQFLNN